MKRAYLIGEKHKMAYLRKKVALVMLLWWLTYTYLIRVKFFPRFSGNAAIGAQLRTEKF